MFDKQEYQKNYYRLNKNKWTGWSPDKAKKAKELYNTPYGRIVSNLARCKRRVKKLGLNTDITIEDLLPLPTHCPILGIELNYGEKGSNGPKENSPSIDRINPSKGYEKGNVHIISQKANQIKSNATVEEIQLVVSYLKRMKNVDITN